MTSNNYLKFASHSIAPPLPSRPGAAKDMEIESIDAFEVLPPQSLKSEDWYWGKITRDEAAELLKGKRDGSFLVRDSLAVEGEYTLTVRKSNMNRMLKITSHKGLYGVCHPYRFSSVIDLIEYYLKHSLAEFSGKLDINLKYPIAKTTNDVNKDVMLDRLKDITTQIIKLNEHFTQIECDYEKSKGTLEELSVICRAQQMLEQFLSEHMTCMNTILKSGMVVKSLPESRVVFERQYLEEKELVVLLNNNLEKETLNQAELQKKVNLLRSNLNTLMQQKDKYERWLHDNGVTSDEIEAKLEESLLDEDIYGVGMASFKLLHKKTTLDQEFAISPHPSSNSLPIPNVLEITKDICTIDMSPKNICSLDIQDNDNELTMPPPPSLDRLGDYFDVQLPSDAPSFPNPTPRQKPEMNRSPHQYSRETWMAINLSRNETEAIFKKKGKQEGSFLVRPTTKVEDPKHKFTLEVQSSDRICRLKIFYDKGIYFFNKGASFQSVEELIDNYTKNSLAEIINSLNVTLLNPLLK